MRSAKCEVVAERPSALDYLEQLRECSLILTEEVPFRYQSAIRNPQFAIPEMRYRLLETLREYGAEQLSTGERTALAQRHLDYYRARFQKELPGIGGRTIQQRLDEAEREQDNLRAALDWWMRSGAPLDWILQTEEPHWGLLKVLASFWLMRGYTPEGRQRLAEILALPRAAVPPLPRAFLLLRAGELAQQQGDVAAADAHVRERLAIYQGLGHKTGELGCCQTLAVLARDQGDTARARSFHEEALAMAQEAGDERDIASALYGMGHTAYLEGDLERGRSLLEEALQILRKGQELACARVHPGKATDDPYDYSAGVLYLMELAWACAHRGEVADASGEYAVAHTCLEESLTIFREFGRLSYATYVLHKLGRVAQHRGQWSAAAAHFAESLAFWQQDGNKKGIAACLEGLAAVAGGQGEPERAARLLGAAAGLRESRSIPLPPVGRADLERVTAGVRADLGEEAFAAAWAEGQALRLDQAIAEGLEEAPAG